MIEAKGPGYLDQLLKGTENMPWIGIEGKILDQAARQTQAAGDRPIEWYFAEKGVADYVRDLFEKMQFPIKVIFAPLPR